MRNASPKLVLGLLIALTFTLATGVRLRALSRPEAISDEGAFKKLLGDGRRLFAGQSIEMADVYLHSGFYPSIFDRREGNAPKAVTGKADDHDDHDHDGHPHDEHEAEHEKAMDFMGPPHDWLEGFIRRFRITKHTHLENGEEREILPWLKLSIELDPQSIETYTITAYWLRSHLKKAKAAEEVLREGMRNNPGNYEILFELGLLYQESYKDSMRARNVWLGAKSCWEAQSAEAKAASLKSYGEITVNLARLEDEAGNWQRAIQYFELAKQASPDPDAIQRQINEIQAKNSGRTNSNSPLPPIP